MTYEPPDDMCAFEHRGRTYYERDESIYDSEGTFLGVVSSRGIQWLAATFHESGVLKTSVEGTQGFDAFKGYGTGVYEPDDEADAAIDCLLRLNGIELEEPVDPTEFKVGSVIEGRPAGESKRTAFRVKGLASSGNKIEEGRCTFFGHKQGGAPRDQFQSLYEARILR